MSPKRIFCKYEKGEPGSRSADRRELQSEMLVYVRTATIARFFNSMRAGKPFIGAQKSRGDVKITSFVDSDFKLKLHCDRHSCKHWMIGQSLPRCLLEAPIDLPDDLLKLAQSAQGSR